MRGQYRGFFSGVLVTVLILAVSVSALAISGRMTIEVDPVNIQVNGQVFQPRDANGSEVPVFAYNGTTYAPLRALAEAYGLDVWYDASANLAAVGPRGSAPSAPSSAPQADVWDFHYYVDNFEEPTEDWYLIASAADGRFSNSAVTKAELYAEVLYDSDNIVSFFLYEYGDSQVKDADCTYTITMRAPGQADQTLSGWMGIGGDRVTVEDGQDVAAIVNALKGEGTISFYIVRDDSVTTNYLFSVEAGDFLTEYQAAVR